MKRLTLPIGNLSAWAKLNNVVYHGVRVEHLQNGSIDKGSAVIAVRDVPAATEAQEPLMIIPRETVLSLEAVERYAKYDRHLKEVLQAAGEYAWVLKIIFAEGRTSRGAILIFLLMQITNASPDIDERIGVPNPWTEYVKFLPSVPLPTFWTDEERALLTGTSLEAALNAKLNSLLREFDNLRSSTESVPWCMKYWWHEESGRLNFDDWKTVDAIYRSRALEHPGTGDAMVPCLDMANHASAKEKVASYDTDQDGNGVLLLRPGKILKAGDEVTITYGDEKGACEMVFSYGFIDASMETARELFLDLTIPEDDPLREAKRAVSKSAPGVRLFFSGDSTSWESTFIWLICINQEDGLNFKLAQTNNGETELELSWKGDNLNDTAELIGLLKEDDLWHVFQLRAVAILQDRVETQLRRLYSSEEAVEEAQNLREVDRTVYGTAMRLRVLEAELLESAHRDLEEQKTELIHTDVVQQYLGSARSTSLDATNVSEDEDFS
ncbi:MAG: hypothetical protein M1827_004078 [Pycnora praestabilis]|nr:MAG: hypothetical protein M1827_004078 [Pycnora praestabilis]